MPRGLILDMDGTLVDSEPLSMTAWNALLAEHGVPPLAPRDFDRFVGVSSVETARTILSEHAASRGQSPPAASIVAALTDAKRALLVRTILELSETQVDELWFHGVRPLLAQLHDTGAIKLVLCTSSDAQQAGALMDRESEQVGSRVLGLRVTRDDVPAAQMKPAPTPYLRAAELLGLLPRECVAVEDSASGVASAATAGYGHVLGVLSTTAPDDADALKQGEQELKSAGATKVFQNTCLALEWVLAQVTTSGN
jgi:HAD superfamily hydrolase (TIGR01509 family)